MVEFEEGRGLIMQEHNVKSSSFDNRSITNLTLVRISPNAENLFTEQYDCLRSVVKHKSE